MRSDRSRLGFSSRNNFEIELDAILSQDFWHICVVLFIVVRECGPNIIIHPNSSASKSVSLLFHNKIFSPNINHCNLLLTMTYSVSCEDSIDPTRHFCLP